MAPLTVYPAPGLKIPNPETGTDLPDGGAAVEETSYWRGLIRNGDVLTKAPGSVHSPARSTKVKE